MVARPLSEGIRVVFVRKLSPSHVYGLYETLFRVPVAALGAIYLGLACYLALAFSGSEILDSQRIGVFGGPFSEESWVSLRSDALKSNRILCYDRDRSVRQHCL
jgi:hypothetical protein